MPAFIFHGDPFLVEEALRPLRGQVGPADLLESNSHRLLAGETDLGALRATCDALPFLAQNRLVIVEGLLASFESREPRRRGGRGAASRLAKWDGLDAYIDEMPPTTLLAFADGPIRGGNSMLSRLSAKAQVKRFTAPRGEELARWTRGRAEMKGARISAGALRLLGQYIGGDLRVLDTELEKLALYAAGGIIEEGHVANLAPQVREASVFAAVDAILEGRSAAALRDLRKLRRDGASLSYLQAMIARQLRLVTLAKDLVERGVPPSEMGVRLSLRAEFAVRKTVGQARRFSWDRLKALYGRLLAMDLAVKEGRLDEELALDILVAEAAATR